MCTHEDRRTKVRDAEGLDTGDQSAGGPGCWEPGC